MNKIITHYLSAFDEDNEEAGDITHIPFLFSDNVKYYIMFDKDVTYIEQDNTRLFENDFGKYNLQITQLNPRTIYVYSHLDFNKDNLVDHVDPAVVNDLRNKIKEARSINISFKMMK